MQVQNDSNQNNIPMDYQYQNQQYYPQQQEEITIENLPQKFKPISAWGYLGYSILFAIPIIGLICNLVFCFSDKNINRQKFARSTWCSVLVYVILIIVLTILVLALGLDVSDIASKTESFIYSI